MTEQKIPVTDGEVFAALFGSMDGNIRLLEEQFHVAIVCRDSAVKVSGEAESVYKATRALQTLVQLAEKGEAISDQNVRYCISLVEEGEEQQLPALSGDSICITAKGKPIKAKTVGQKAYCDAIRKNTITLGVGPAGTGKTYLAVAMAVTAFRAQQISRIVLTRPAVEAGES